MPADRLDPDSRESDLTLVVDDPEAHRVAHLRVVRALGEDEFAGWVDPTGQVDGHIGLLGVGV